MVFGEETETIGQLIAIAQNTLQSVNRSARTAAREALVANDLLSIAGGLSGPFLYGDWFGKSRPESLSPGRTALGVPQDAYGRVAGVRLKIQIVRGWANRVWRNQRDKNSRSSWHDAVSWDFVASRTFA